MATNQRADAAGAGTISLGGDLTVNRMGYGAMRITGQGIWGEPADRPEAIRVLRRAVELGVDFIDTADSYGPEVSEELIAEALHPYRDGLVIATKGGFERQGPNLWTENGHPDHLRRALDDSLRRLKLDRIDLWQLHRIDAKVPEADQARRARGVRARGQAGRGTSGLSEVGVDQIERARKVVPIVSVQNKYNASDREWEDVVDYCGRESIAFIPWWPLRAGTLDNSPQRRLKAVVKRAMGKGDQSLEQQANDAIRTVAERRGGTPMQVALAWLLARSPMMLVIPGTSKSMHVEENIAAAALKLDASDLALLNGKQCHPEVSETLPRYKRTRCSFADSLGIFLSSQSNDCLLQLPAPFGEYQTSPLARPRHLRAASCSARVIITSSSTVRFRTTARVKRSRPRKRSSPASPRVAWS